MLHAIEMYQLRFNDIEAQNTVKNYTEAARLVTEVTQLAQEDGITLSGPVSRWLGQIETAFGAIDAVKATQELRKVPIGQMDSEQSLTDSK